MGDLRIRKINSALLAIATLVAGEGLIWGNAVQASASPQQLAQAIPLEERRDQIGTCRGTGNEPLTVYANSGLAQPVGSVSANTSVTLTGVFGSGAVQIRSPQVGWVSSALLKTDCGSSGGLPPDIDTNPIYCRRLRSPAIDGPAYSDLNGGLVARNSPNGTTQVADGFPDGPDTGALVRVTANPPEVQDAGDKRWIRVKYNGIRQSRVGWISNGPAGVNRNLASCR